MTTPADSFSVNVYRLGCYAYAPGASPAHRPGRPVLRDIESAPTTGASTGLVSAANWLQIGVFQVGDWPTGLYVLKPMASDGDHSYVPLVVRDDARQYQFCFQHASNTNQAYSGWGGKSLYEFNSVGLNTVNGHSGRFEAGVLSALREQYGLWKLDLCDRRR